MALVPALFEINSSCFFAVPKAAKAARTLAVAGAFSIWVASALADVPSRDDSRLRPLAETSASTGQADASSKERSRSAGGLKCSVARQDVAEVLNGAADKYGLPRQYLENAAVVESRCNPNAGASSSSAKGLGQFINSTWRSYGNGQDVYDPNANADAMARLTKDDVTQLQRKLGRSPTFEEAYLAHQQGIGGASCLIGNPSAPATNCVSAAAVTSNGGNTGMTGGQFSALVQGYYNTGSLSGARTAVANYDATGALPNSGNFADGSNGSSPVGGTATAASMPPLKRTTPRTASASDPEAVSSGTTGYSGDLSTTQRSNLALLQQRSTAIGGTERVQDAWDVNTRLRGDHVQLGQEAADAVAAWGALVNASVIKSVSGQSRTATAMTTAGGPTRARAGDVMPGIPSPAPSAGCSGQVCAPRFTDNALNVSAYLANFATGGSPASATSPAIQATAAILVPALARAAQTSR